MNEDERWHRKKGAKEEARQAKIADWQRRIQQEAERIGVLTRETLRSAVNKKEMLQGLFRQGQKWQKSMYNTATGRPSKENNPTPKPPTRLEGNMLRPDPKDNSSSWQGSYGLCYPGIIQGHIFVVKELRVKRRRRELHKN